MELVDILRRLWHLRLWLAIGFFVSAFVAYASAFELTVPPTEKARSIEFGAASTQVLIDAETSPLVDLGVDIEPLVVRAEIYARLVESPAVKSLITRKAAQEAVSVGGRLPMSDVPRADREPAEEQRANEISGETQSTRLLFSAVEGLPLLSVYAQASTAEDAVELADAGAQALIEYVATLEARSPDVESTRVELRQLGQAQGSMVNEGASSPLALILFVGLFGLWTLLVLFVASLVKALRAPASSAVGAVEAGLCANCGQELPPEARFCPRCGAHSARLEDAISVEGPPEELSARRRGGRTRRASAGAAQEPPA